MLSGKRSFIVRIRKSSFLQGVHWALEIGESVYYAEFSG